jgi:hydroxylysine kinase
MHAAKQQQLYGEGALAGVHVRMETTEARELLREQYGIEGDIRRLDTEKDDTFKVDSPHGASFVLKVSNPREPLQEIRFQTALLDHVAQSDTSLPTPRMVGDIHEVLDKARQRRYLYVLTYLRGTPLDSVDSTARQRREIGKVLARLRRATANFTHPSDGRIYPWDVQHLLSLRALLDQVQDENKRSLLARGLERFATMAPRIAPLRSQVLHNDFSKSNIIVDSASEHFVTGVIDFGDAVRTAIAIDVATALLNQLPADAAERRIDDLFLEGRPLLEGYLTMADLTAKELALIPHLVMGRVIARALLTLWRARLFPENQRYILRNTEQGWGQLQWFLERPVTAVSALLI